MDEQAVLQLIEAGQVIGRGHFLRASGRHSDHYVQCAGLFQSPESGEAVGRALAKRFEHSGAQLVMSAAIGAVLPGWEVSRALKLPFIYCERLDGAMVLRRGFSIPRGSKVLLIEDEVQTGTSVREMAEIVRALGGQTVGIGCIVDKSGGRLAFDMPFETLLSQRVEHYAPKSCPLCAQGVPLVIHG